MGEGARGHPPIWPYMGGSPSAGRDHEDRAYRPDARRGMIDCDAGQLARPAAMRYMHGVRWRRAASAACAVVVAVRSTCLDGRAGTRTAERLLSRLNGYVRVMLDVSPSL